MSMKNKGVSQKIDNNILR